MGIILGIASLLEDRYNFGREKQEVIIRYVIDQKEKSRIYEKLKYIRFLKLKLLKNLMNLYYIIFELLKKILKKMKKYILK